MIINNSANGEFNNEEKYFVKEVMLVLIFIITGADYIFGVSIQNCFYKQISFTAKTQNGITYIPLGEGFSRPNSAWGSIGITKDDKVYIIVCDHISDAAIYEFDTKKNRLFLCGSIKNHLGHRFFAQRQPKVHTPLLQYSKDNRIYFGTDAGDESEYYLYGHSSEGYSGGYLASINPATKVVENLGLVNRWGGIKSMTIDQNRGLLYYTVSPTSNLFKYDIESKELVNLGRINCEKVVRTLFLDKWGNVYGASEAGELVRYNKTKDSLEFFPIKPFGGSTTGPSQVVYSSDTSYVIGYDGYSGKISRYYPDSAGAGRVEEIGNLFTEKKIMARNLNIFDNILFVICTSIEEVPIKERFRYLTIFDLRSNTNIRRIEMDSRIHQAYGHAVTDKKGNMYVCGFWDASDYNDSIKDSERVFLIKINPKNFKDEK